jgi:uncharacterized membrane protein YoaK (UPF0700 family)
MASSAADVPGSPRAALVLAAVAGSVDVVGYLTLDRLFVAHMSGNSARLGAALGGGDLTVAGSVAFAVVVFVLGIGAGTALGELLLRRGSRWAAVVLLGLEVLLLVLLLAGDELARPGSVARGSGVFYGLATPALLAMGVQTAALRRVGGRSVHTTYVSGVLTGMTTELVLYGFRRADRGAAPPSDDDRRALAEVAVLAGVWLCYAAGGVVGGLTERAWRGWSLLLPIGALLAVAAVTGRTVRGPRRAHGVGC